MNISLRLLLVGFLSVWICDSIAQISSSGEIQWLDDVISRLHDDQEMNAQEKSDLADSAFYTAGKLHDLCRQINLRIIQATYLDNLGRSDSALLQLYWANRMYNNSCDSLLLMSLFRNLTNIYLSLNEFSRVDSVGQIALNYWNPNWKEKDTRFAVLNNMAISTAMTGDFETATRMFHQAYKEALIANNETYIQKGLINLGGIKGMTEDFDSAYVFFSLAADRAKASDEIENYTTLLINMAYLENDRGNPKRSIVLLDSAYAYAEKIKSTELRTNTHKAKAILYASLHDYEKAYQYQTEHLRGREQILDEERIKAVTEMMEKYESEKKARQIQQLELDKLDATLTNERITNTRNTYLIIGSAILLLAIVLYSRLRYVHKSRIAIQHEKDISEGLLLNILPGPVADELKQKGYTEAKHFESVTILFSDFKDFTTVSQEFTADELVNELNVCFKAFDEIMTKHGIEKIKTIGDSYMAAGSIPQTNIATATDVINAGIDMQYFISQRKKDRNIVQLPAFDMRIGIHSGPVVAGVVGVKKFQYDIWGDTVNIASRMETNGEVGKVNISEATYQLVKDNLSFSFSSRGMIYAKGKGELPMYFVEHISR